MWFQAEKLSLTNKPEVNIIHWKTHFQPFKGGIFIRESQLCELLGETAQAFNNGRKFAVFGIVINMSIKCLFK